MVAKSQNRLQEPAQNSQSSCRSSVCWEWIPNMRGVSETTGKSSGDIPNRRPVCSMQWEKTVNRRPEPAQNSQSICLSAGLLGMDSQHEGSIRNYWEKQICYGRKMHHVSNENAGVGARAPRFANAGVNLEHGKGSCRRWFSYFVLGQNAPIALRRSWGPPVERARLIDDGRPPVDADRHRGALEADQLTCANGDYRWNKPS